MFIKSWFGIDRKLSGKHHWWSLTFYNVSILGPKVSSFEPVI